LNLKRPGKPVSTVDSASAAARDGAEPRRFTLADIPGLAPVSGWARLAVIGALALFLALALEQLLWIIAYPLALVFTAVVIAQGLAPVVQGMTRYLPRPVAVIALYLALLVGVAGSVWLLLPALVVQGQVLADNLPGLEVTLRAPVARISPVGIDQISTLAGNYLTELTTIVVQLPVMLISVLTNLALIFFLSLYWLIAQPSLRGWLLGLAPDPQRDVLRTVLDEVGETVGGYVRGVLLSALSIGVLTYIGLRAIGMPSPLVLAVFAGFGELIPILGPFLSAVPALAVALASGAVNPLVVLAFYVALQQVESNILVPLIMRGQARIPPLLSLVGFLIGAAAGGLVGALIAIPLFGALRVIAVRMLVPAERHLVGVTRAEADAVHREEVDREAADSAEPAEPRGALPSG
ncbi:MAG TPA: AI-2E family transporter, partial [Thermomicrobiaceae bacterium]|nr:AI-2E family transporter [Thermomicrobiaceae bacterium]